MHSAKQFVACTVIAVCCLAGTPAAADEPTREKLSPAEALAHNNNVFAINLYQQLRAAQGNIFFSPYSIRTALSMTYTGARGNTASQMKTALNLTLEDNALNKAFADSINSLNTGSGCSYEMNVANSLWVERTHQFLQSFIDMNRETYDAGLKEVDFIHASESAREEINTWVEAQTRQRIQNLIPPGGVNADTRLTLVNAVYFKGRWEEEFDKKLTRTEPFYCAGGRIVEAPLMSFSDPQTLPFFAGDGIKIVELDYFGGAVSMLILLPDTADGLNAIEKRLDETLFAAWLGNLHKRRVSVHLPRFSINWGAENMVPPLRELGMRDAFVAQAADFSGIDGTRDLLISSVFHKAYVDVYEEGTEAAAATGVMVGVTSMPPPPEVFRADHPFIFLIREKPTGAILFMGRLTQPGEN